MVDEGGEEERNWAAGYKEREIEREKKKVTPG